MPANDWQDVVAAMKAASGRVVGAKMSDEVVAAIEHTAGVVVPPEQRQFQWQVPQVEFAPGLTDAEIVAVEGRFGFQFPPDLREFLQTALPCGQGFPNWRSGEGASLHEQLALPVEGICFDVEHNGFWLPEWGPRPGPLEEALRRTRELVADAPVLIPLYEHRFIPAEPHLPGNPVLSVHQTDIIHYGSDLRDYWRREFHLAREDRWPDAVRSIRFWDIARFQEVRWAGGPCVTDPRTLPEEMRRP